jgi:hypothetical protein
LFRRSAESPLINCARHSSVDTYQLNLQLGSQVTTGYYPFTVNFQSTVGGVFGGLPGSQDVEAAATRFDCQPADDVTVEIKSNEERMRAGESASACSS